MSELITNLVRDNLHRLHAYQPGKPIEEVERELGISDIIKVASNENPLGPSAMAMEAGRRALEHVHLYPDGAAFHLRRRLAESLDIEPSRLVFGAGSNEVVQMLIAAFCVPGKDEVLSHKYAFISYRLQTLAHGCTFVESDVTDVLGCDVDALLASVTERTKLIFVANPNNPTGAHLKKSELERLMANVPSHALIVIDEAYYDYARLMDSDYPNSQIYAASHPQLVTLRTFSKIYGLAGLRVGYGICHPTVADYLNRIRRPFNVNSVAQEAACTALEDAGHITNSVELARAGIETYSKAASDLGVVVYPSLGNFVLVDVKRPAEEVYDGLLRKGVIVRPMTPWGLSTHLRISVGSVSQNARVISALKEVLTGK